jgi:multiple sugar transport system permease protein
VVAAFTFLFSWNDLVWPLLMTHRTELRTLPVGLTYFRYELGTEWHLLLAASMIAALPAFIVMAVLTRNLHLITSRK